MSKRETPELVTMRQRAELAKRLIEGSCKKTTHSTA
jgi:hypothetical protein